jgi:hypothetical protein
MPVEITMASVAAAIAASRRVTGAAAGDEICIATDLESF